MERTREADECGSDQCQKVLRARIDFSRHQGGVGAEAQESKDKKLASQWSPSPRESAVLRYAAAPRLCLQQRLAVEIEGTQHRQQSHFWRRCSSRHGLRRRVAERAAAANFDGMPFKTSLTWMSLCYSSSFCQTRPLFLRGKLAQAASMPRTEFQLHL